MLGCIPRSPSPEAPSQTDRLNALHSTLQANTTDPSATLSKDEEVRLLRASPPQSPKNPKSDNRIFQARLALLEGDPNVKNEPTLKREPEDSETSPPRKRSRPSRVTEVVDLTD